jgi:signal transduction histidine kinase
MQNTSPKSAIPEKISAGRIKLPILVPLICAILVLLFTFTFAIYHLQKQHITGAVRMQFDSTRAFFEERLSEDARLLSIIAEFLKNDPNLQNVWLARDRDRLLRYTSGLFEKLRADYRVTHFYFIDPDQTCFLRVHNPSRYGDKLNRFTLHAAGRDRKPAWGIELGPYGTFTLRVIHPWLINGSPAGFIELGEEIEHITPELKEGLGVELAFLIKKSLLNRNDWEEGLRMTGRSGNWDLMPDYVIADATLASIPPEFIEIAALDHSRHENRVISIKINDESYRAGFVKLFDAAKREVGDILVIKNVSKDLASLRELLAVVAILCFLTAAGLVSFFYVHITNIEKHLFETRSSLITEIERRKQAERELRKHRDNLEEIVRARTGELEETNIHLQQEVKQRAKAENSLENVNKDLESTIIQLIQTNRQLNEFAHLAAHDLKTPLRGIGTLAQWLIDDYHDKFDEKGRRQIELLIKRVERMNKLTDVILQYSTIARNAETERPVDLNLVIEAIISEIKPPPNIQITVSKNLPVLICEERHIRQVLYNLVDNAVKFMDKQDGRVEIDCVDKDTLWEFSVSDNGPGIERQHFERIFSLFQTLKTSEESENTGAGLTMVRKIVELYEGTIWLSSEIGRGTTFYFTFPKQSSEAADSALAFDQDMQEQPASS